MHGKKVAHQFEITDVPFTGLRWSCASKIFTRGVVKSAEAWQAIVPTIRACVKSDFACWLKIKKGYSVCSDERVLPPFEVGIKGIVKFDSGCSGSSTAFCGEDPIEEGPTRADDPGCEQEATGEARKITFGSCKAGEPVDQ